MLGGVLAANANARIADITAGLANDDHALHAKSRVKRMGAFQRILTRCRNQREIDGRMTPHFDLTADHEGGRLGLRL